MKILKLDILFLKNDKEVHKEIKISDEMYDYLMTPYRKWGDDMEKYVGVNEDDFYVAVYTIQTILLGGILNHYYGLDVNEWTVEDQNYDRHSISFAIDVN